MRLPGNSKRWCTDMANANPALKAFVVEVRTDKLGYARYHAIAENACQALLDSLDRWGIANITVRPMRKR